MSFKQFFSENINIFRLLNASVKLIHHVIDEAKKQIKKKLCLTH